MDERKRMAGRKREIFGWAMFDVANSAYTTVVITLVYSAFFVDYLVPEQSPWRNSLWGFAMAVSSLLAMMLAPIMGALVDLYGGKKRMLMMSLWLCALATGLLYFVGPGGLIWALGLIVISNTAWMLSEVFCAAYLTDLADERSMGWISGLGWGLGYLGGLASLVWVLFGIIQVTPERDLNLYIHQNQLAMVAVAAFLVLVSLPSLWWLRERRPMASNIRWQRIWPRLHQRLNASWHLRQSLPVLWRFLGIFTLYSAGMAIIIKFFGIYLASELSLTPGEKTAIFLALQLSALLGALLFGVLERAIGPKATVILTLLWWAAGVLCIFYLKPLAQWTGQTQNDLFMLCSVMAGAGLGATQSASRTLVGLLAPRGWSSLVFGLWGVCSRASAILGSLAFALVADLLSLRQGLLVILAFFLIGALLLLFLPYQRGREQALTLVQ
ncbi:MFS transporter [Ferrimonas gelatinilytica]|uniref:MFS transporter n=2 Tax=Ferrimonas gelatinilytica TaxID=1255257 RepID=A0ABP9RX41_9GAMM